MLADIFIIKIWHDFCSTLLQKESSEHALKLAITLALILK